MKWFKHDCDANRDPKLEKVLMRYGADGYALYWLCLELIAAPIDRHNITFELEHDAEILAYRLKIDSIRVEEIMKFMIQLGLFEMDQTTQRVTCLAMASRLENSIVKSPYLKEVQRSSRMISDDSGKSRPDIDIDSDLDKEKDLFDRSFEQHPDFSHFWQTYPRKVARAAAEKAWKKLKPDHALMALILKALEAQKRTEAWTKDNGAFIPHPATWLNQRRWEDELPQQAAPLSSVAAAGFREV